MIVLKNKAELKEGEDYRYDKEGGVITFLKPEPCVPKIKWWQFWRRYKKEKITIIYTNE